MTIMAFFGFQHHRDHILRHGIQNANTRVAAIRYDINHSAFGDDIDMHIGIAPVKPNTKGINSPRAAPSEVLMRNVPVGVARN